MVVVLVVRAVSTNSKTLEGIVWSQRPCDASFIFPLVVNSVATGVADLDKVPVVGVSRFDVLGAFKEETGLPRVWHWQRH